jgi:catalase
VGALVTDGVDRSLLDALKKQLEGEGATLEIVAPAIGGVAASDGTHIEANHRIGGGPSVLFDAVAVLPSAEGATLLLQNAAAAEFISDAFGHLKFIAWTKAAMPLLERAGVAKDMDDGCLELTDPTMAARFVAACRKLRRWEREQTVKF